MKTKRTGFLSGWVLWMAGAVLMVSLTAAPSMGAERMDEKADTILKFMSPYFGELKTFSMNADIDLEIVGVNGQKLQISSFATTMVQRPDKFYITRKGMISDAQFIFDGTTLTVHGKRLNAYYQTKGAKSIDEAIRAYESETGISAPGADTLFSDPYTLHQCGTTYYQAVDSQYVVVTID